MPTTMPDSPQPPTPQVPQNFPHYAGIPVADGKMAKPLMKLMTRMIKPPKVTKRSLVRRGKKKVKFY